MPPADKQNRPKKEKGRETISLPRIKMAADTKKEMEDWSRFLWDRGLEGRRKQMINGFLWIKKAKVWQRYYCIADAHYFEWFEPQKFVRAPSLVSHERIVDVCCVCVRVACDSDRRFDGDWSGERAGEPTQAEEHFVSRAQRVGKLQPLADGHRRQEDEYLPLHRR